MPVIAWDGGRLTREQKQELVRRLTEVATEVTKIPAQFYSVIIREQPDENLGFAGETVEEMKTRMLKK
jgi:4-oxalocrotonate tautomerase